MGEIEAQAVGRNERAGLVDMVAETFAQGGVQDVRCCVVAHDVPTALGVDDGASGVLYANGAGGDFADVHGQAGQRPAHVRDCDGPGRHVKLFGEVVDFTGVADLTAAFYIEGGFGQNDFDPRTRVRFFDNCAVHEQCPQHRCRLRRPLRR